MPALIPEWRLLVTFMMLLASTTGHDSLAEWSKALAQGASLQGRGLEPHSCHACPLLVVQTWFLDLILRARAGNTAGVFAPLLATREGVLSYLRQI